MKQLKPQDAQFLYMEDGHVASHVTSIMICDQSTAPDGIVRFKEILSTIENRLGNSPLYSQKLMRLPFDFDFPYWVEDPHFELEYHVRHSRLPEPADWRQLCIHVARFHSRPLDMARPPWEIYIIEGLDNVEGYAEGSFACLMKMHHSAVDGTSAQQFMFSMMDLAPGGPPMIPPPSGRKLTRATAVSASQVLTRAAINNATSPVKLANAAMKLTPRLAKLAAKRLAGRDEERRSVPMTRFNGSISPNRAFDAVTFDLADFKTIAKAFPEAKINDVVLAVCGGALRKYLKSKNELPIEPLIITAPINKRSGTGSSGHDGNDISAMTVPIFTNIANASERMKAIVKASQRAKQAKSGLSARIATDLAKHVPAMTLSTVGSLLVSSGLVGDRMSNAIVSNVPGVQIPLYFCGAQISGVYAMAPIGAGMGLFITTPSYNNRISFSITTTRQIMPDTPYFMNCLKASLKELKNIAEKMHAAEAARPKKTRHKKTYHRTRKASEIGQQARAASKDKSEASTKPVSKRKPRVNPKPEPRAESKTKAKTKAAAARKSPAKSVTKAKPKPKVKAKAGTKSNGAAKPGARKAKAKTASKPLNGAAPKSPPATAKPRRKPAARH